MNLISKVPGDVQALAKRFKHCTLVGGAVVDMLSGKEVKDWDIEVYGHSMSEIEEICADLSPNAVGAAFGILKITLLSGTEIDLSVPRRENKQGIGHKGFEVIPDPFLTPREAARRRDFTINSMGLSLSDGEIIDPFGGLQDLEEGILRITDPTTFVEDPLRVLRAMQLLARKCKSVDPASMMLMRGMKDSFSELPKERVYEEFSKLLLKAPKPSVGFQFLLESKWIEHFPELVTLIDCPQKKEWHPEGDVWTHSLAAVDAAATVLPYIPSEKAEAFMFGTFLHDVGKPLVTIRTLKDPRLPHLIEQTGRSAEDLLLTSIGHDIEGMAPAETFLRRITNETKLISLVKGIVGLHMQPYNLYQGDAGQGAYARLHRKMVEAGGDLYLLSRVCQCDACATGFGKRIVSGVPDWEHHVSQRMLDYADKFSNEPAAVQPKVMGRDLIAVGIKPGIEMGKLLKLALEMQEEDAGLSKEEIIIRILN